MKDVRKVFYNFANCIFKKDWFGAYNYLKEYVLFNPDKNALVYSLLLERILKYDGLDFSFISELNDFSEERVNGYQIHYNLAYDNILSGNYEEALKYFINYQKEEKKANKSNDLETVLISILLEEITSKEFKYDEQAKVRKMEKSKALNFSYHFKQLQRYIEEENYLMALTCCDNIKEYCNEKSLKNFDNIYNMLLKIIEMIENERCVIKESLEYPDIKDFNFILNLALKNGDYLTALRNVGKCIYYSPDSSILKIYRSLLYTISDLNKKNQQKEYILKVVIER